MPPRMPNPIPAARMAAKPAQRSRFAFGAIPLVLPLLIVLFFGFGLSRNSSAGQFCYALAFSNNFFGFIAAPGPIIEPNRAKDDQQDGRKDCYHAKGLLSGGTEHFV